MNDDKIKDLLHRGHAAEERIRRLEASIADAVHANQAIIREAARQICKRVRELMTEHHIEEYSEDYIYHANGDELVRIPSERSIHDEDSNYVVKVGRVDDWLYYLDYEDNEGCVENLPLDVVEKLAALIVDNLPKKKS
jgi:hypothetical protein